MKELNCLVENDGEIVGLWIQLEDNGTFIQCYRSGDLDDSINSWEEFKESYGNKYWPDLKAVYNHAKSPTKFTFEAWLKNVKALKLK